MEKPKNPINPMSQIAVFLKERLCHDTGLTLEQLRKSPEESVAEYKARILAARDKVRSDRFHRCGHLPKKDA